MNSPVADPVIDNERLAQRLADCSRIVGRAAHDFDNLLTGILGFSELMAAHIPEDSQPAKYLIELIQVAHRGQLLTAKMHEFSRGGVVSSGQCRVADVINRVRTEHLTARPDVPVFASHDRTLDAVVAIAPEPLALAIRQVLDNACEAIPPGGRVAIAARPADLSADDCAAVYGRCAPGPHVVVTVTDSGPGFSPAALDKLFVEPFFTTKPRHRGLGLATAYRVLHAHAAGLRFAAGHGGTVVEIVLPAAGDSPRDSRPETGSLPS